jgi:aerobic carbon-monoxide dehydrogenase medium subunit
VIQHKFDYRVPREINEALEWMAAGGERCAVLGGGTWLIPNMTFAAHQPDMVLDPKQLGLESIVERDNEVIVGARATYADALRSRIITEHLPMLATMAAGITGGTSITAQGTMGGSACYANPSSDVPACLVALRARLRLRSVSGIREIDAAAFFHGRFMTARRPDEILTDILFPKMSPVARCGYEKLKFSTGSWPIVTAAAVVEGDVARIVVGAATDVPILKEALLPIGADAAAWAAFARSCADITSETELSDELAGRGYRERVAPSIVLRALQKCGVGR